MEKISSNWKDVFYYGNQKNLKVLQLYNFTIVRSEETYMNFMEKFNELANRTLVPIANKLGNQRHLAAIRDGMVVAIPLSILGGVCLIISTPPFKLPNWGFVSDMLNGWYNWAQANKAMLQLPYNMTMALMGLFIAFAIAYHLADEYEMPKLNSAIVSTAVFLIVSAPTTSAVASNLIVDGKSATDLLALAGNYIPTTYLDAKGIFTAILVAIGCVEIMHFMFKKDIRIKMPEGVPPAISSSFDAILPLFICVIIFYGLSLVVQNFSGQLLPSMIMTVLAPAISGLDSLVGICLITMIAQVFWFFGLHGASITQPIRLPFMQMYLIANISAFSAGQPIVHYFTQSFWSYVITLGGGGATMGLCILLLRSKSAELKTLGKLSIGPAIFNINEPIIFGLPLVMNPMYIVPFILSPVVCNIIGWFCVCVIKIIPPVAYSVAWTTPGFLIPFLGSGANNIMALVIGFVCVGVSTLIYLPFVIASTKAALKAEGAENA